MLFLGLLGLTPLGHKQQGFARLLPILLSQLPAEASPGCPRVGAWPTRSVGSPAGPPPAFGGVGSAGWAWADQLGAWMLFILECSLLRRGMLEQPKVPTPTGPQFCAIYYVQNTEYCKLYYAPGLVAGICTGSGPIYAVLAQTNSRFCTRDAEVGNPPGLGRRPDWCALERLDDDESRPQGPPGPRARHAILRGKRAPLWLALAGPDGPRLTFIDDPGPNATRILQMEVVGSQGGLQSGFRAGCWHAAGLLAPWGGCRVSPGFPGTARECASERQRAPESASPFDSLLRSASLGFVARQQTRPGVGWVPAFRAHLSTLSSPPPPSAARPGFAS